MLDYACTVRQIAVELKRHPVSVINKLVKYLDDDSIQNRITQDFTMSCAGASAMVVGVKHTYLTFRYNIELEKTFLYITDMTLY